MLLKALVDYAKQREREQEGDTLPTGYQPVTIHWLIPLDGSGNLQGMPESTSGENDRAKIFQAPSVMRSGQTIRPKLFADNAEYTLGIEREGAKPEQVAKRHQAYKDLVETCAKDTGLSQVQAVAKFLETHEPSKMDLPDDFKPEDNVSFVVDGELPFELPKVKSFWKERNKEVQKAKKGALEAECLLSGERTVVMDREPVKIKGTRIPNGQPSGMNIISANESAYESYGLKASQIAPIKREYAEKYANALNTLLTEKDTHLRIGDVVYVFWTKDEDVPSVAPLLNDPGNALLDLIEGRDVPHKSSTYPEQARKLLSSAWVGRYFGGAKDRQSDFFAASLSASGSRVVVRDQIQLTIAELIRHLERYFASQTLVDWEGNPGEPFGIYALAASLYRDATKEMVKSVPVAILAHALKGTPLPWAFLSQLVARNRASQTVTRPRATLTKMVLLSNARSGEDYTGMEKLVRDRPETAYHLGRLLAALDAIQSNALGNVKAGVIDRFYGSFSTAPASVFGRLMQGATNHLSKIRKEKGEGAFRNADKRLQEILSHVSDVPATFDVKSQALFSLGFYHEKADFWEGIMERKRAKDAREQTESDSDGELATQGEQ